MRMGRRRPQPPAVVLDRERSRARHSASRSSQLRRRPQDQPGWRTSWRAPRAQSPRIAWLSQVCGMRCPSRKPFRAVSSDEGSNPSPSARPARPLVTRGIRAWWESCSGVPPRSPHRASRRARRASCGCLGYRACSRLPRSAALAGFANNAGRAACFLRRESPPWRRVRKGGSRTRG
jgi:hypothetical protein